MVPIFVLDAGLKSAERKLILTEATVVNPTRELEGNPALMKAYPKFLSPAGTIIFIDSDIIVTGNLDSVLASAEDGGICLFPDKLAVRDRWFQEWATVLQLKASLRRETYVNSGFLVFSVNHWPSLLDRWWEVCELVPHEEFAANDKIFNAGDQDALNALLMSEFPPNARVILPEKDEAFGGDIRIDDIDSVGCSFDGVSPLIVHYLDRPKPWQRSGWLRLGGTDYARLMRRLLFGDDVALCVSEQDAPFWLRPTPSGDLMLRVLGGVNRTVVSISRRAPQRLRERLRRTRRRVARSLDARGDHRSKQLSASRRGSESVTSDSLAASDTD